MDDPCDQPFPRPRLPLEQQRGDGGAPNPVEGGQVANLGAQGADGRGIPHEALGEVVRGDLVCSGHGPLRCRS